LEGLYKSTTEQAFEYCVKFNRTGEFKRLAELLRTHVSNTLKATPTYYESQENVLYQLTIRFAQLTAAVKLQLWQEAFRTVEDMKGTVLVHAKTPVPSALMASYYENLATLFFISNNYFHHALALSKYNAIKREMALNDDQDAALASEVDQVYSALSPPSCLPHSPIPALFLSSCPVVGASSRSRPSIYHGRPRLFLIGAKSQRRSVYSS